MRGGKKREKVRRSGMVEGFIIGKRMEGKKAKN